MALASDLGEKATNDGRAKGRIFLLERHFDQRPGWVPRGEPIDGTSQVQRG